MKFINFDTVLNCEKNNYINKNKFTPQHCSNFLIVGKTGIGKTNFLLNILNLNSVWDKIFIYSNNVDNKYQFLLDKFPNDVKLYLNEIDFSDINSKYQNLVVFDDLVFSNKKISTFFTQSRKLNTSCCFISHRYFSIDRLLRNNLHYIIFFQLDKKEINLLYLDISLDISLDTFQKINNSLKPFENIIIDKKTEHDFFKIRKNLDEILK